MVNKGIIIFTIIAIVVILLVIGVLSIIFGSKKIKNDYKFPPSQSSYQEPGKQVTPETKINTNDLIQIGSSNSSTFLKSNAGNIAGAGNTISVGQYIINGSYGIAVTVNGVYVFDNDTGNVTSQIFVPQTSLSSIGYFELLGDGNIGVYDTDSSTSLDYTNIWSTPGTTNNKSTNINPNYKPPSLPSGVNQVYFLTIDGSTGGVNVGTGTTATSISNPTSILTST